MFWRNAKPCAGTLISRNGKLLLLRRAIEPWLGRWDIPGGYCDASEHPADCAVREAREETGLEVHLTGYLCQWIDSNAISSPVAPADPLGTADEITCLNTYYAAETRGDDEPMLDVDEVDDYRWFGPEELPYDDISFPGHCREVLHVWASTQLTGQGAWAPWDRARLHLRTP